MTHAKQLFFIPGFPHSLSDNQYQWLFASASSWGYNFFPCPIVWKYRTLTQWCEQFALFYEHHPHSHATVLGFSYGAMIALATALKLSPERLVLCSLSPFFAEDLATLPQSWIRSIGKKRVADFSLYHARGIASGVPYPTDVLYGSVEAAQYPQLKKRCSDVSALIPTCSLRVIDGANHALDNGAYQQALSAILSE